MDFLERIIKLVSVRMLLSCLIITGIITWYFSTTPAGASARLFSGIFICLIGLLLLFKFLMQKLFLPTLKKFRERNGRQP
ncbi:hypothetical protein [Alteromonas antoniana]|uniref:hypothetical protein n=1 Tax=Alteromonas antoniana TaxID=2803813 RepID=UPI001C4640C4|nr:hypothetical protein [Alteromonas antoniana]